MSLRAPARSRQRRSACPTAACRRSCSTSTTTSIATSASGRTRSLWRDAKLPFELQFFHPGLLLRRSRCASHEIVAGAACATFRFDPRAFRLRQEQHRPRKAARASASPAFASTSRSTRRNTRTRCSCSWAPATSARSARASATACRRAASRSTPALGSGEEFPRFTEFWIERPTRSAKRAHDLRAARLAARHRRLPLRRDARHRDGDAT